MKSFAKFKMFLKQNEKRIYQFKVLNICNMWLQTRSRLQYFFDFGIFKRHFVDLSSATFYNSASNRRPKQNKLQKIPRSKRFPTTLTNWNENRTKIRKSNEFQIRNVTAEGSQKIASCVDLKLKSISRIEVRRKVLLALI